MSDRVEEELAAQIWVLRFKNGKLGRQAQVALESPHQDGTLQDLMDAKVRPDRAPAGSMAKILAESLRGSQMESTKD